MKRLLLLAMLVLSCSAFAADTRAPDKTFEAARESYDAGNYADAVARYDELIAAGWHTPEIYFNRGNALARLNETGEAIASYQTAILLNPRDADSAANLKFVRNRAGLPVPKHTLLHRTLGLLTPQQWRATAIAVWWVFAALLCAYWIVPHRVDWLRQAWTLALLALLIAVAGRAYAWQQTRAPLVIVTEKGAQALYAPLPDATHFFDTPEGTTLRLVEQTGAWLRVRSDSQIGWIPAASCAILRVAR
ncbi:MAG: tetratricopeptide repeat protein [Kiritimatiellae bacterium]|nr:tetratricopeptide repeat protein [Kiritimatiellia bacterium]